MAAGTGSLRRVCHVGLLAGADLQIRACAVAISAAAAIEIDYERSVHQVAMTLEQKGWSVRVAAGLLISRERDNQISCRAEALTPQADQRLEHRSVALLHVEGAPAVEPAILLRELEWIERPVLGSRLD